MVFEFWPYVAFLINAEANDSDIDVSDGFSTMDVGLAYGVGYQFEVSPNTKLFVEYEGQSGFMDVFENNSDSATLNVRYGFNIGVLFGI